MSLGFEVLGSDEGLQSEGSRPQVGPGPILGRQDGEPTRGVLGPHVDHRRPIPVSRKRQAEFMDIRIVSDDQDGGVVTAMGPDLAKNRPCPTKVQRGVVPHDGVRRKGGAHRLKRLARTPRRRTQDEAGADRKVAEAASHGGSGCPAAGIQGPVVVSDPWIGMGRFEMPQQQKRDHGPNGSIAVLSLLYATKGTR